MPLSSDGIVTFGVGVDEEYVLPFPWPPESQEDLGEPVCELGEYLARRRGVLNPRENAGPGCDPEMGWPEGGEPADWPERVRAWHSAIDLAEKEAPIELISHCSHEVPMYIVALKGTTITAKRGYPQELILPTIDPVKIEVAAAFCRANAILPFENPGWLLCSYMG